ncbi:fructosamine kinase family protein [Dermatophilus congolensis]|uniref:fructosamine kinase family protein n=1 Tax=Dermatophilus congolensis TaxID=1863 RepID=UPI001AAFB623|nr:fructosamine kinase family protein [Dermatophilus congolensis]MBO3143924.1 fructosamine kinase family protein [Dermatophilus congolensis]MBO3152913.1 fructosamine kinase family protein [Dermatophilus congolensis]MBO3160074.1 fructosamine kinase family protein [Dermatophilus congolensis]MBO3164201.1 fructosamine kinase family protein [Dermatophilus congolensis]MBO3177746.1 fructosamine kinase family protein [Dermatophilus congolensis]
MSAGVIPDGLRDFRDVWEGFRLFDVTVVRGGDVARSFRAQTPDGAVFIKVLPDPVPGMFEHEALGLQALREHAPASLNVPRVLSSSRRGLVLEWIDEGERGSAATEEEFGRGLAGLHGSSNEFFGGINGDARGVLGTVGLDEHPCDQWPEFFAERRLVPLTEQAVAAGRLDPRARGLAERLAQRADKLCGAVEPPALLHGDLWAGNRLVDVNGRNWLVDPAVFWGHREYDVAMMMLFGGFGSRAFAAYEEVAPLADGWKSRVRWYQLPPLLVHTIMFGGSYGNEALAAMGAYL